MESIDPKKFRSSVIQPEDFDQFWSTTLDETENIPLNAELTHDMFRSTSDIDVFTASYSSYGNIRISGWYARPKNITNSIPGQVFVPGYVSEPKLPNDLAKMGYAAFSAAPRGKLRSNSVFNPGYPGLLTHNINNYESYGYRGFYMDAIRAFDFLASLDEVDNTRIGIQGGSQGGALTLLLSSLRSGKVKAASAGAPYLCSMMDSTKFTRSYPYEEINDYLRLNPEDEEQVCKTLNYYDIQNFVDRITCPIIMNIGLKDDVCPPETGYAVFDEIGSTEKKLYEYDNCAHDSGGGVGHAKVVEDFMYTHLRPI